ncbi:major facilitator superfamily domain-containing protein [Bisporella sp. PMI_857]|nr:major facilitator superfamily domain-containing protein [Bisporella sp. PMI_857]
MSVKIGSACEATHAEVASTLQKESAHVLIDAKQQDYFVKKYDRNMLWIVCILYVLSYIDRGNIGNAKTAGAQDDLGLSSSQWAWVLNSFYICYTLFEWATLLWKIFPAHIYVTIICICWGVAAMSAGAATNMAGLAISRAFLGVLEAGFGAGAPFYLSIFYQRKELGLRVALLTGMSPLANCFAASLAYGITHIKGSLEPWRLLFIIEGAPTIAFAPIVYFFLPDSPNTAKFLSEDEQTRAVERMHTRDTTAKSKLNWKQVTAGLSDYQNYVHALIHFCCNYSFAGLSNFLPTIVQNLGYTSIQAQGLTAPPYLAAFILCVLVAFCSDKYGNRGFVVAGFSFLGAIGYLLLATLEDTKYNSVRYLGIWLACCGVFPALAMNIAWLLNNQGGESKRGAGLSVLAIFGQTSSFLSSAMFPKEDRPYFVKGCAIGCAFTGLICILALGLHFKLERENKKRDADTGPIDASEALDLTELSDKHPKFRYIT